MYFSIDGHQNVDNDKRSPFGSQPISNLDFGAFLQFSTIFLSIFTYVFKGDDEDGDGALNSEIEKGGLIYSSRICITS